MILSRPAPARLLTLVLAMAGVPSLVCAGDTRPPNPPSCGTRLGRGRVAMLVHGTTDRSAQWWQSANALEATVEYMQATGSRAYVGNLNRTYAAYHQGDRFLDNYYYDDGWWALAWIRAYDLTGDRRYLGQAQDIFEAMTGGWGGTCGGGMWWSTSRTCKNAIANELFLTVAAELHNRIPGDTRYAGWARREWAWFSGSGMITRSGLVIDGLTALAGITHGPGLLATARRVADAVIRSRTILVAAAARDALSWPP